MEKLTYAAVIAMTALLIGCTKEVDTPAAEEPAPPLQQTAMRTTTSPIIDWSSCYGTAADDIGQGVDKISVGSGYFIVGAVSSKSSGYVAKVNSDNNTDWSLTFGGNASDELSTVVATSDGGCIVAGITGSTDIPGYSGGGDVLVAKISYTGQLQWKKALGTPGNDRANKIISVNGGGFALVGYSDSKLLVIKLNAATETITSQDEANAQNLVDWQQSYQVEGYTSHLGNSIVEYGDFFYITGSGHSSVTSVDPILYGKVYKANGDPVFLQALTIGEGSRFGLDIIRNGDNTGNLIVGRIACSAVMISMTDNGEFRWMKSYGGGGCLDLFTSITPTGTGYLIAGKTNSKNGDITGAKGGADMWLLQVTADGTILKSYNLGGTKDDEANEVIGGSANEYMVVGSTRSTSGDVFNNKGGSDMWAVKVKLP